jgi:hypothetical protein
MDWMTNPQDLAAASRRKPGVRPRCGTGGLTTLTSEPGQFPAKDVSPDAYRLACGVGRDVESMADTSVGFIALTNEPTGFDPRSRSASHAARRFEESTSATSLHYSLRDEREKRR